ncbi:autotransporter outer membrane beta-barrel domain-containing protein [Phascolarctobacterium faecium]|nr:autotransporter outer membrane beta-barrel domain-containing protein [Phascolarctobacterium faecium]
MKNNGKSRGMDKKKAEKILATVVMGMNLVNTVAPLGVLVAAEQKMGAAPQPARSEAEPLDYAVLPQLADMVDRAIFARAEATEYDGNASVASMGSGDTQTITAGQSGTVSTMNGGTQHVLSGGVGSALGTLVGEQQIGSGGTGYVEYVTSKQIISGGGTGIVGMVTVGDKWNLTAGQTGIANSMNGGSQTLSAGGTGTVSNMSTGSQIISSGGKGTVITLSGGIQCISNGGSGTVSNMNWGNQIISNGGVGTVSTMSNGRQTVELGGSGTVSNMSGGNQIISNGGVGTVSTMNSGYQNILSGGSGTVSTMNGGTQYVSSGGSGIVSTMSGGTQAISSGGLGVVSALNCGTQIISRGGTSLNTVLNSGGTVYQKSGGIISNITYSGGVQVIDNITAGYDGMTLGSGGTNVTMGVISGAQMSGTILNNGGAQLVLAGGTALATKVSGGIVSGLTMTGGSLELAAANGGSFAINGTLSATNASIDMTDHSFGRNRSFIPPAYETLTIDKLTGSGNTFIMDTDLGSDNDSNSDKLIIKESDGGTQYVQIRALSKLNGIQVTGEHKQLLITDKSGKLTFEGKGFNAGGLWDIDPTLAKGDTLGQSANNWYLTKVAKTANNDTRVLLEAADNSYALWRNTNDSLRSRLGALGNGSEHADGILARTQAGRFSGDNYEGRYNLYQLGYDKAVNDKSIYGLAADYGDGTGSYDNGSGKDKLKSFSLYGVWTADNGSYTNVTARYGIVATDLESYGDYPDKAEYKQHAYSVSVEYGKRFELERGLFIEPNAQFTLGRLGSIDYTTDRGVNGRIDGMNSALGRIGFVMGQKIENGSDIYLKADLLHEFAGERDLVLTSDAGGTNDILTKHNDYGDTWFELGLGGNVRISKTGNFYGEVTRGFGGDINKKWSVNAGLRFTF